MYNLFLSLVFLILSIKMQAEQKSLSLPDVHNEMNRILQVHVTQNTMSPHLIAQALSNYIDQFDPFRVYLLQEDVDPYLTLSEKSLEQLVDQYNREDYAIFDRLNTTMQKAIKEMQSYRKVMIVNEKSVQALAKEPLPKAFAQTRNQLEARQAIFVAQLITRQVQSMQALNRQLTIAEAKKDVDIQLQENENSYLFVSNEGKPLESSQRESLFASHILQAFMTSLDVHSQFLNPKEAQMVRRQLEKEYVGVGIGLQPLGKRFIVSQVVKGSSAEKSGKIRVGDEILSIDGTLVDGLSSDTVLSMLQGPAESSVRLGLYGSGRGRFEVSLPRQVIVLQEGRVDARYQNVRGGIIAFIQLHGFYQGKGGISADQDIRAALQMLKKKGTIKGLVLDLRDNHGGFLQQAVKVAGLFMKCGVVVVAKDGNGKLHYFRDLDPERLYDGPMVVLTSKETASAAEIVAQCLKDYGIAVVVGDADTYGKGSIQLETPVAGKQNQQATTITIGRYYSVSGMSTQLDGVKADVVVPGPLAKSTVGEEFLKGTLSKDSIAPSFDDKLPDIPKEYRLDYERRYLPNLQRVDDRYRRYIPDLVNFSHARLAKNDTYQSLMRGNFTIMQGQKKVTLDPQAANSLLNDIQEKEAIAILEDLMQLSGSR